jgi:tRNA(Arg) A34 adenosine deaminase TadA/uncharacterized glyoxalase superfamily protein PhnB
MRPSAVKQLRVVLATDDLDAAVAYYRDTLGLAETAAIAGDGGARLVILEAGRATLELANLAQVSYIADVETAGVASTPVRLALEVDDAAAVTDQLIAAGAELIAAPVRTPWNSLNARLHGPAGVQVTIFQELASTHLVGESIASLGDESGVLARLVDWASLHGAAGELPFAALVVRDGVVVGAGANTALSSLDPSAHGEVTAIRDATSRTGSLDLRGAVVYSSCEPCAICRTVSAAAGVSEIVFAARKELVPNEIDGSPRATAQLIDAVTAVLPGIARPGATRMTDDELAAPFRAYLSSKGPSGQQ